MDTESVVVEKEPKPELEAATDVQTNEKVSLNPEPILSTIVLPQLVPEELPTETSDLAANEQVASEQTKADVQNGETNQSVGEPLLPNSVQAEQAPASNQHAVLDKKKKEEDKLSIYKALAIKLKKELVKVRDEFQRFQLDKESECRALLERVQELEKTLADQSETSASTISTLEATLRNLKQQLENSEQDLCNLQENFENYKNKAQQIMQDNSSSQPQCNKIIEDERLRQLRQLNDDQLKHIDDLDKQFTASADRCRALELELGQLQEKLVVYQKRLDFLEAKQQMHDSIQHENDSLKIALKQFRSKLKEPNYSDSTRGFDDNLKQPDRLSEKTSNDDETNGDYGNGSVQNSKNLHELNSNESTQESSDKPSTVANFPSHARTGVVRTGSPQASLIPPTFEITSRSSAIEDARNQIDSLTKAYLDSENTNSLLSDQVVTLKQEIRRLQLATERIELADNLEYLKNIVLKFISLDGSQTAQKQRLVPVLSTVLKLSPDETMLLNSTAMAADKNSLASSFFRL